MASGIQHPNEPKKKEKENLYGASTVNSNIWICTVLTGKIRCCQSQQVSGFIAISHLTRCIKTYTSQSHGSTILLMYFVDSFVLNGWWLLSCSTLFRASYKSHLWCLCTQIQMHCTHRSIQKLDSCHALALQLFQFVYFFYSRNMRDLCVFYIIITLHFITFGLFSSYMRFVVVLVDIFSAP